MPVSKNGGAGHLMLVTEGLVHEPTPCVKVSKMRSAGVFDDWCCIHHHWLNGMPALSVLDAEMEHSTKNGEVRFPEDGRRGLGGLPHEEQNHE